MLALLRLQSVKVISCALRVGGCRDNRQFILPQQVELVPEIGSVVIADFRGDAEVGAEESGFQFRNQSLPRISCVSKSFRAEIAVKAVLCLGSVRQLMQGGRVIAFLVA